MNVKKPTERRGGKRLFDKPTVAALPAMEFEDCPIVRAFSGPMDHCRFPFSQPKHPDFRFCDQPRLDEKSYCAEHYALCVVEVRPIVRLPRHHRRY